MQLDHISRKFNFGLSLASRNAQAVSLASRNAQAVSLASRNAQAYDHSETSTNVQTYKLN